MSRCLSCRALVIQSPNRGWRHGSAVVMAGMHEVLGSFFSTENTTQNLKCKMKEAGAVTLPPKCLEAVSALRFRLLRRWRQEDRKFRNGLGYMSLKPDICLEMIEAELERSSGVSPG